MEARCTGALLCLAQPCSPGTASRHEHGRAGRHEPDEDHADERGSKEDERGDAPAGGFDQLRGERQGHGHADARAGVRDPEREARHTRIPASDGRRGADEGQLQPDRVEDGIGEDHERDVRGHVDGQPATGEQDHGGGQQVAVGELVVGPAQERARDGRDDEEHRPGRDRNGPADPELVGERDRHGGKRVQPAVGDRADHEGAEQRQRQPGDPARLGQWGRERHPAMLPAGARPARGPCGVRHCKVERAAPSSPIGPDGPWGRAGGPSSGKCPASRFKRGGTGHAGTPRRIEGRRLGRHPLPRGSGYRVAPGSPRGGGFRLDDRGRDTCNCSSGLPATRRRPSRCTRPLMKPSSTSLISRSGASPLGC